MAMTVAQIEINKLMVEQTELTRNERKLRVVRDAAIGEAKATYKAARKVAEDAYNAAVAGTNASLTVINEKLEGKAALVSEKPAQLEK